MKTRRLFWKIVDNVEALIDSGIYPCGSRLPPERELAEMYDVSRPTIREAIIALEVRERIDVKTGSGVYVSAHQQNTDTTCSISAFELTQARALVEGEAAALAAHAISKQELNEIRQTIEDMKVPEKADHADSRFHQLIALSTKNNALVNCVENLWRLRRTLPQVAEAYSQVCSKSNESRLREHICIFNAISSHDACAARRAMHSHFDRLINALFDASETKAMEEIKRKTDETRDLYSLSHLQK